MLHLWGRLSSINVRKVVWTLQELGVPFERTDAGLAFGINKTPDYLQKNPNALVPLLEDTDGDGRIFSLWESNVVVRYLCAKHSDGVFYPRDLHARFDAERWMDWQQTAFNGAGRDGFHHTVRLAPEKRNADAVRASVAATEPLLAMLDAHLATRDWMAGDAFGMADIPLGCEMHRWWGQPAATYAALGVTRQGLDAFPHLAAWWARLQARPAARGVLDIILS
jgi:glutathione S-transferase